MGRLFSQPAMFLVRRTSHRPVLLKGWVTFRQTLTQQTINNFVDFDRLDRPKGI
jgi:hypothetical protein